MGAELIHTPSQKHPVCFNDLESAHFSMPESLLRVSQGSGDTYQIHNTTYLAFPQIHAKTALSEGRVYMQHTNWPLGVFPCELMVWVCTRCLLEVTRRCIIGRCGEGRIGSVESMARLLGIAHIFVQLHPSLQCREFQHFLHSFPSLLLHIPGKSSTISSTVRSYTRKLVRFLSTQCTRERNARERAAVRKERGSTLCWL